jgi:NAD(P)-dependent dehydrogenase (short-subunit alcohol dehydrogenase family)
MATTVLITGASQGIGAAIARSFAGEPESRVLLVARNRNNLETVARQCRQLGAEAVVLPCDVSKAKAVDGLCREVLSRWGAPDVLVNNAGLFRPGSFMETDAALFSEQIAVNLTSAFLITRGLLPGMAERGSGTIFFMGSVASVKGYPGGVAYCAAKHGVLGLARVVREEMKDRGIRVTTVLPGATFTPSWEGAEIEELRLMPAEDIASAVLDVYRLSPRTVVEELLIRPQLGDL